jgi:hypothetical protein
MALTTPYILKIRQGLTFARNYKWTPGAGSASLVGKVIVFRLKNALVAGGHLADFVLKSSDDPGDFEGSSIVLTDAAEGEFALTLTDEMTATFEPIENIKWSLTTENGDGSKSELFDGKARIVEING